MAHTACFSPQSHPSVWSRNPALRLIVLAGFILLFTNAVLADCPCGTSRITTFPSIESFSTQTVCPLDGVQCSTACSLSATGVWQNVATDDMDWTIHSGQTSTPRTGPAFDATSGNSSGKYAYLESSCPDIGYPNENAILYGNKCFNFQSIVAPELTYAYHMYGEEMGQIRVEASIDSCNSWQTIDTIAGPQQQSSTEAWRTRVVSLLPYAGRSAVRLRIRGTTGSDQFSDLAIDDINIHEAPCCDISATRIISPVNRCGMGSAEQISVELKNLGFLQQSGFPVAYSIDGGPLVTETFTGVLAPGATTTFAFTTRANLSAVGEHVISVLSGLNGDLRTTNDSISTTIVSIPTISTFPYSQNFESGKAGWTVTGTNSSWAFGTPAKSVINSAASGIKSWVTGGLDQSQYPDAENSAVLSPCFDFSSIGFPVISLKAWWNAEGGYDGAVLQSSIDGGLTWQRVGAVDDSSTWYNNGAIVANPGGQSSGWTGSSNDTLPAGSGGWVAAGNTLAGLAGRSSVRLRIAFASDGAVRDDGFAFDDILISDGFSAQQTGTLSLDSNANGRADPGDRITYTATLRSLSSRPITGVIFNDLPNTNTSLVVGSVTTSSGVIQRGNSTGNSDVRVQVPSMAANSTVSISYTVLVKIPGQGAGPQICNQASVVGNGFSTTLTDDPSVTGSYDPTCVPSYPDSDGDGVIDYLDRCPGFPDSVDTDHDGVPDGCDRCPGFSDTLDSDNDGIPNGCDGCPNDAHKSAPGVCGCGVTDADSDNDGTPNCNDQCPTNPLKIAPGVCGCATPDTDSDLDGVADCLDGCPNDLHKTTPGVCGCGHPDTDSDGDGAPDCIDQCPADSHKTIPGACGCGHPDTDSDGDGIANCNDQCPQDPHKSAPGICGCGVSDGDANHNGIADCLDQCPNGSHGDTDGDGVLDCRDGCPTDPRKTIPGICGCGVAETDTDFDGTPDCIDHCPADPFKVNPGACGCGTPETDTDGDGTPNCIDGCPTDPHKVAPGSCGCGILDTDSDGDGSPDCIDQCPLNPRKTVPGQCGCAVDDIDTDSDGTADCKDLCPRDPLKTAPGICGCGTTDTDSDGDGIPNCNDLCPNDSHKTTPGECGCGSADTDSDNDGVANCHDGCPFDPQKVAAGACGCGVSELDSDDDGTPDCLDQCPADPLKTSPGGCGCGLPDTDTDGDGAPDCIDLCVTDPAKSDPGICGCGMPDSDADGDGVFDCQDHCPLDSLKVDPGVCGCGISDRDSDGDGIPDCQDACPVDEHKGAPGQCGCGIADTDSDGDGIPDCLDRCPADPTKIAPGQCGCGAAETDSNRNGIPDCRAGSDLKQELSTLGVKVKQLAVFKGKKGPQPILRATIKGQLSSLEQFIKIHGNEIVVARGAKPLPQAFGALKGSMKKLIAITDKRKLALYKRNMGRLIVSLIKAVS